MINQEIHTKIFHMKLNQNIIINDDIKTLEEVREGPPFAVLFLILSTFSTKDFKILDGEERDPNLQFFFNFVLFFN